MKLIYDRRIRWCVNGILILALSLGQTPWTRDAQATGDPGAGVDTCGNPPSSCSSCGCEAEGSPADNSPSTYQTDAPVNFNIHSVVESAVDLSVPGPTVGWQHKRSYDSRMSRGVATKDGYRWHSTATGPYLTRPNTGTNSYASADDIELYVNATVKRWFKKVGSVYEAAQGSPLTLYVTGSGATERIVITNTETNEQLFFYGLNTGNHNEEGRLYRRGVRESTSSATSSGNTYHYNLNGSVDWCLTESDYYVDYQYNSSDLLKSISVYAGPTSSATLIQHVEYTYFSELSSPAPSGDLGMDDDLVQVKVSKRATFDSGNTPADLSIVRYTQYRYYYYGTSPRYGRQLKMVLESSAIQRAIDLNASDSVSTPIDLLALDDAEALSDGTNTYSIGAFASRSFTYDMTYAGIGSPSHWPSPGAEDLQKYADGGSATQLEFQYDPGTWDYVVASEKINGGCSSCGGSASPGTERRYYYLEVADWYHNAWYPGSTVSGSNPPNESPGHIVRIVIEDTLDSSPTPKPLFRKIYGVNYAGSAIRTALLTDPINPSSDNIWCWSTTLNSDWRVVQRRMPSAHKGRVTSDADLAMFFNPTGGASPNANDAATVNSSSGLVYHYQYDNTVGKRPTAQLASMGTGNTPLFLTATDYGDTNGDSSGVDVSEGKMANATYAFRDESTANTRSSGIATTYAYTYWNTADDIDVKTKKITLPAISSNQNGSGQQTETWEYYDKLGQLRWTVDGEGYINYYSYHPVTGQLAYVAIDVDPASAPPGATGNDTKWLSWDDDGDGGSRYESTAVPSTRDIGGYTTDPDPLEIVSTTEYDELGRETKKTDAGGGVHVTQYFNDGVARFPYVSGTAATLPVQVQQTNNAGVPKAVFGVRPNAFATTLGSIPSSTPSYTSLVKYTYHAVNGQLEHVDRYHDADGTTQFDDYYRTSYLYDALGRRGATIQDVASGKYQVSLLKHDVQGRLVATYQDSTSTKPTEYSSQFAGSDPYGGEAVSGYAKLSEMYYDGASGITQPKVGDGHITKRKQFWATGKYTGTEYHRTFRGHVRGMEPIYDSGSGENDDEGPFVVNDIDWMGRVTATAKYSSNPGASWPTDYADYVFDTTNGEPETAGHFNLVKNYYDDLGRVYENRRYTGTQGAMYLQTENYYDRNGRLVATGDPFGTMTEHAYDGAGRGYQTRVAKTVLATPYSGGAYDYNAPDPHPDFTSMSGGGSTDGCVIELTHQELDAAGNAEATHVVELNHNDTDGFSLSSGVPAGGVRHSTLMWYDSADRLTASAYYGAADHNDGDTSWTSAGVPAPMSAPTASDANALVTLYTYNADTGRLETVEDPADVKTKTFYDDLGRRTYVAENYVNFTPPTTSIGSGDEDRVTAWKYSGLGQVTKLTAYNGSSTAEQETDYFYEDPYNASLATHSIYPDASTRTAESSWTTSADQVRVEYNLDGSVDRRKDQRDVVLEYTYDDLRRVTLEAATTVPSGVYGGNSESDAVLSIGRAYDSYGRLTNVTSYGDSSGTSALNEIEYAYHTNGTLQYAYQEHDGAATSGSPKTEYKHRWFADNKTSGPFENGLRLQETVYPLVGGGCRVSWFGGPLGDFDDRLHRPYYGKFWDGSLRSGGHTHTIYYDWNGAGRRLARLYSPVQDMNLYHQMYTTAGDYDAYDRFGRVTRKKWTKSGVTLDHFEYEYEYAGNRTSRDIPSSLYSSDDRDQVYAYDGLHRLTDFNEGELDANDEITDANAVYREKWTLDQLGNSSLYRRDGRPDHSPAANNSYSSADDMVQNRYYTDANELDGFNEPSFQDQWVAPVYDAAGNMTTIPSPQAIDGNSLAATYDAWNRLVKIDDGNNESYYGYDGLHRRIEETNGSSTTGCYYNEQWQCLVESTVGGSTETAETIHMWHPHYVDALAVSMRKTGDDEHFFTHDANFNVTAAVEEAGTTDNLVERYAYTPYGECTVLNGASDADPGVADWSVDADNTSDIGNEHLYTGRRTDTETGLQLNRARFYHQQLGRWVSRDPIGYRGGFNLYGYVGGMPTRFYDPMGLQGVIVQPGGGVFPGNAPPNDNPFWGPDPSWDHYDDGDGSEYLDPDILDQVMNDDDVQDWISNVEKDPRFSKLPCPLPCGGSTQWVIVRRGKFDFGTIIPGTGQGSWLGWLSGSNPALVLGNTTLVQVTTCVATNNCPGLEIECTSNIYIIDEYKDPGKPIDEWGIDLGWEGTPYPIFGGWGQRH